MRVAIDTAVLIDYGECGADIWSDVPFDPNVADPEYRDELVALNEIMHLWMVRDIRFHVFERQMTDCKVPLSENRSRLREHQIEQLYSALACLGHGTDDPHPGDGDVWPSRADFSDIAPGLDGELLADAVESGCHVFLTREKRLLRRIDPVARHWLRVLSPTALVDLLFEAGEFALANIGQLLLPDSHKWLHAMSACDATGE